MEIIKLKSTEKDTSLHENELSILDLPVDVILKIFSYLDIPMLLKLQLVCNPWRDLVMDPSLWNFHKSLFFDGDVEYQHISKVITKCCKLQEFDIRRGKNHSALIDDDSLFTGLAQLPHLRSLQINNFKIDASCEESLKHLIKHSPSLISIDLNGCDFGNEVVEAISEVKGLKCINISSLRTFKYKTLLKLMKKCNQVESVDLSNQMWLEDEAVSNLLIQPNSNSLKSLVLKGTCLTDIAFDFIENCLHLYELQVSCRFLSDDFLEGIMQLPNLECLELYEGCFSFLALRNLFIQGSFTQLFNLNLTDCKMVDDRILEVVADNCKVVTLMTIEQCQKVTDRGIFCLIRKCSKLRFLALISLLKLNGDFLDELHHHKKNLMVLYLNKCYGIDKDLIKKHKPNTYHHKSKFVLFCDLKQGYDISQPLLQLLGVFNTYVITTVVKFYKHVKSIALNIVPL